MAHYLNTALRISLLTIVLVGLIYPLVLTGLAQVIFPYQANGSLLREQGVVRGSALLGQSFLGPGYFHPRPSAAGAGYDALASGGSNLGPTSQALHDRVETDVNRLKVQNPGVSTLPVDMVTASGSGLDPDITLANALAQLPRVASARRLPVAAVRRLLMQHVSGRQFGILGEPRVNVLQLNRALLALPGAATR